MSETPLRELIRSYEERGVATEFCQYVLGTLVAYDREHNADLLHTLRVYFRCNGNTIEAARQLFLHRNSLQYRLERIEGLLQCDLKDPQTRLALNLAVEMAELLQQHSTEEA